MQREGVGLAIIAVGVLVLIGAARGTWRKLFYDVSGIGNPTGTTSAGSGQQQPPATSNSPLGPSPGHTPTQDICRGAFGIAPWLNPACELIPFSNTEPTSVPYTIPAGWSGSPVPVLS